VELSSVFTGDDRIANDGVFLDAAQASGLAYAAALGDVVQDVNDLVLGEATIEQGSALAFGEACLAGLAVQQATLVLAVAGTDGKVAVIAFAEVRAVVVLATEEAEVVHGRCARGKAKRRVVRPLLLL
jgi:hypothetical protein